MGKKLRHKIGVQLTLWYSGIFTLSCLAVFSVAFFLLQAYFVGHDRELVQSRLQEYELRNNQDGFDDMLREIREELKVPGLESFYVRVSDEHNRLLFSNPDILPQGYDLSSLDHSAPAPDKRWIHIRKQGDEDKLEILTAHLSGGQILQIGTTSDDRNRSLERFLSKAAVLALPIVALAFLAGIFLSFRALRPIRRLISTVTAIKETGKLGTRVPVKGTADELDELSTLFNAMLADIERLVSGMREALDNVAHDLRTPMTRLRNTAEAALHADGPKEAHRDALADCLEQSEEVITTLRMLMDISEAETGTLALKLEPLDVSSLVNDVIELYRYVAEEKNITVTAACAPDLEILGDRTRVRQSLANLLDNALKYTGAGGRVEILGTADAAFAVLEVRDTGIGIPPQDIGRIWERLYRGGQSHTERGSGLGLSLVKAMVEAHQGSVEVESDPAVGGSRVRLRFPRPLPSLSKM